MISLNIKIEQKDWGVEVSIKGGNSFCTTGELETFRKIEATLNKEFTLFSHEGGGVIKVNKG